MDQIFDLQQIFEKSWEYAKEEYTFFVDLEKAYDRVSKEKLWEILLEYDMRGQLFGAIKPLYKQSEVCFRFDGIKQNLLASVLDYARAVFFLLFCSLYT